jgi:hypothetical protein
MSDHPEGVIVRQSWFSWRSMGVGVACGLTVGLLVAANAPAPPALISTVGRYQLRTWSHAGVPGNGGQNETGEHGAYRLDTQTGDVWEIRQDGGMMQIGK